MLKANPNHDGDNDDEAASEESDNEPQLDEEDLKALAAAMNQDIGDMIAAKLEKICSNACWERGTAFVVHSILGSSACMFPSSQRCALTNRIKIGSLWDMHQCHVPLQNDWDACLATNPHLCCTCPGCEL